VQKNVIKHASQNIAAFVGFYRRFDRFAYSATQRAACVRVFFEYFSSRFGGV
jgi:hypothetical protein